MMTERERFLRWYESEFGTDQDARLERPVAWAAWQARCPEGCKVVPVEPTEAMVDAASELYMPFGDMRAAIHAAVVYAPDEQQ